MAFVCVYVYLYFTFNVTYIVVAFCYSHSACSINNLDGGSTQSTDGNTLNLSCSEKFYEENMTCLPQCDAWTNKPPSYETLQITVLGIASVLGTICGAIGIIASIIQYKSM